MPKASDDDGELNREEEKEAARKHLAKAVKAFKKSEKTDDDKRELEEVVTRYIRILTPQETKVARKLSDTYKPGGRRTRRRRRGTMRR
jgi:hypothetical protein